MDTENPLFNPLAVTKRLIAILEEMGILYVVGGSLASSLYGFPRSTQDVDIVARLSAHHISGLASKLEPWFFVDEKMLSNAVQNRTSFNIIDKEELLKIDVFAYEDTPASRDEMERRRLIEISEDDHFSMYLCSPEDSIVHKLYWYKLGEGVSDRQWNDAVSVIKVQHDLLDVPYMRKQAALRGVTELLEKALSAHTR